MCVWGREREGELAALGRFFCPMRELAPLAWGAPVLKLRFRRDWLLVPIPQRVGVVLYITKLAMVVGGGGSLLDFCASFDRTSKLWCEMAVGKIVAFRGDSRLWTALRHEDGNKVATYMLFFFFFSDHCHR